jgi:hypothetical protein
MKKTIIIERVYPDGSKRYVIQQKHWLFRWMWTNANNNAPFSYRSDAFDSLEDAKKNLCWFDGTKIIEKVIV